MSSMKDTSMEKRRVRLVESLKVLLHGPFHPTIWFYVMRSFPEHEFYVTNPQFGYAGEKSIPGQEDLYHLFSNEKDIDVQVIVIHLKSEFPQIFDNILRDCRFPIVWFQNWHIGNIPNPTGKVYPLIYTSITNHSTYYPLKKHVWIAPHPYYWREEWKGDWQKVFVPLHIWDDTISREVLSKCNSQELLVIRGRRTIEWETWQSYFIHCRALLDLSTKYASTILAEAMSIGMPVVARTFGDAVHMIRKGIDGWTDCTIDEAVRELRKMLDSWEYAKIWGEKAKKRASEIFSVEKTREVFKWSFEKAIEEGGF